jgi:hypothetical protein
MPIAPLAFFRLRSGRFLLLGPIPTPLHLGRSTIRSAGIASGPGRTEATWRSARTHRSPAWAWSHGTARTWSAHARRTARSAKRARTSGTGCARRWPGLGFLDDDRPALHQPSSQLLDGQLSAGFGFGFDESETARAPGFAIHRDPDTANLDLLRLENLFQLLFVNVVGEVPYEKARSHKLLPLLLSSQGSR